MAEAITLAEIDEALAHANRIPLDERGPLWQAFVDRLLNDRLRLESP
jgi:hypothetical protein